MNDLLTLAADKLGCVKIWRQGDQYLAACEPVYRDRHPQARTTWDAHPTPEDAIAALLRECGITQPEQIG